MAPQTRSATRAKQNAGNAPAPAIPKTTTTTGRVTKTVKKKKTTTHRYYQEREAFSALVQEYQRKPATQNWVAGAFDKAAEGEKMPPGAIEVSLVVPEGFEWIVWPKELTIIDPVRADERIEGGGVKYIDEVEEVDADIRAEAWVIVTMADLEGMEEED
jgi:hypothetical protein